MLATIVMCSKVGQQDKTHSKWRKIQVNIRQRTTLNHLIWQLTKNPKTKTSNPIELQKIPRICSKICQAKINRLRLLSSWKKILTCLVQQFSSNSMMPRGSNSKTKRSKKRRVLFWRQRNLACRSRKRLPKMKCQVTLTPWAKMIKFRPNMKTRRTVLTQSTQKETTQKRPIHRQASFKKLKMIRRESPKLNSREMIKTRRNRVEISMRKIIIQRKCSQRMLKIFRPRQSRSLSR